MLPSPPPVVVVVDTTRPDSLAVRPDTAAPPAAGTVRFDFGSGETAPDALRAVALTVAPPASPAAAPPGTRPNAGELRLVRGPGAWSGELARRAATGERMPAVVVDIPDSAGALLLRLRLADVTVRQVQLAVSAPATGALQERLAMREQVAQLQADEQEAVRVQRTTEALDQKRMSSAQEVARARDRTALVTARLAIARRRLAMAERAATTPALEESVTLAFARMDVESAAPGGTANVAADAAAGIAGRAHHRE